MIYYTNSDIIPEIKIYITKDKEKPKGFKKFLQIFPFIIIVIHLFLVIFKSLPIYFYKLILYLSAINSIYYKTIKR